VPNDRLQETTTGGLPHVYKHRRATRRQVTLAYEEGDACPQLVITEHPGEPPDGDPIKLDQIGISHLSFTVPSVARLTEDLLVKGYQIPGPNCWGHLSPLSGTSRTDEMRRLFACSRGVNSPPRGFFWGWQIVTPARVYPWKPIS
jgi:hypothetical protein